MHMHGVLEKFYEGHQGKTRKRAIQSVCWPGLCNQIEEMWRIIQHVFKSKWQHVQPLILSMYLTIFALANDHDCLEWNLKKALYPPVVDYTSDRYIIDSKRRIVPRIVNHSFSHLQSVPIQFTGTEINYRQINIQSKPI